MALGIASLTVEEQATTFATLAAGGKYATPHVIKQLTQNGNNVPLKITYRQVLTPAQAADVDYALSFDTINGTAQAQGQLDPVRPDHRQDRHHRPWRSQRSSSVRSRSTRWRIGMFTNQQNEKPGGQIAEHPSPARRQPDRRLRRRLADGDLAHLHEQ